MLECGHPEVCAGPEGGCEWCCEVAFWRQAKEAAEAALQQANAGWPVYVFERGVHRIEGGHGVVKVNVAMMILKDGANVRFNGPALTVGTALNEAG